MRVVLITQGISRIVHPMISSRHEVVGIAESAPRMPVGSRRLVAVARRALGTIFPRLATLSQYARSKGKPYHYITKESMAAFEEWASILRPDIIVIFSMSQLLPKSTLSIAKSGCINLHPSFLPEYRGPNPQFWQYFDFLDYGGVTVHRLDSGEDTGSIIYQERVPVESGLRSHLWMDRVVGQVGVKLLLQALDAIAAGHAPEIVQPASSPNVRARNLRESEYGELVDWESWPLERIWHFLRGTETWLDCIPQPAGIATGQRWSIEEMFPGSSDGVPGTIVRRQGKAFLVCRDGMIRLAVHYSAYQLLRYLLSKRKP